VTNTAGIIKLGHPMVINLRGRYRMATTAEQETTPKKRAAYVSRHQLISLPAAESGFYGLSTSLVVRDKGIGLFSASPAAPIIIHTH
jgi:hypothetical protein